MEKDNGISRVKVTINHKTYTLSTDSGAEYTERLAKNLDKRIADMRTRYPGLSVTDCALLTALDCMDELMKANQNIDNIRSQIKDYVDDAGRARNQANSSQREIRTLKERVAALEKELSERTNYAPADDHEEPVSAEEILSQDIREAIAKPVERPKPNMEASSNFVGTVNYNPSLNGGKR